MIVLTLLLVFVLVSLTTGGVLLATRNKMMKWRNEYRIGIIGTIWFTYVSWACIYMAQYRPLYIKEL
ncbi:uncharacterized protein VNE69_02045 [Vairimorpha necatrix]|uniref:Membrane protein n=1 Tax=Vairimorpha necatrix TaxID=6039 RepID=A0AAX4J9H1_9MICR